MRLFKQIQFDGASCSGSLAISPRSNTEVEAGITTYGEHAGYWRTHGEADYIVYFVV